MEEEGGIGGRTNVESSLFGLLPVTLAMALEVLEDILVTCEIKPCPSFLVKDSGEM